MKVVFLARKSLENQYLAYQLLNDSLIDYVIWETGTKAKRRKLDKYLKPYWKLPFRLLDLAALLIYSQIYSQPTKQYIEGQDLDAGWEPKGELTVEDANDEVCISKLSELKPDILLVCGTAILKQPALESPRIAAINLHGGIVPKYRNVHSDFWVFKNKDYENLGLSVLKMDTGIDSGQVVATKHIPVNGCRTLEEAKVQQLQFSFEILNELLSSNGLEEKIKKAPAQDMALAERWPTPGVVDILKLFVSGRQNVDERSSTSR